DRTTMEMLDEADVFFPRPHALALSPAQGHVYVASLVENRAASLRTSDANLELLDLDGPIHTLVQFAVTPDGQTLVSGGHLSGPLLPVAHAAPATPALAGPLDVGAMPWHPGFSPDGATLSVPNPGSDQVTAVDVAERRIVTRIGGRG